ncbi:MAG: hypothetical protein GF350_12745 [Chitinivibrionales bacterium]|nr:hypothetical protein [Chitinivibrionales bacterium]
MNRRAVRGFLYAAEYICIACLSVSAANIELLSTKTSYRFDGIATHGWETELAGKLGLNRSLKLTTSLAYLDATQEPVSGITHLRGQIASGCIGAEWRTLKNHLLIDMEGGADRVLDWTAQPRGALTIESTLPLPASRFIQNVKLTPEIWYTHSMFNGPAIKNRVASYGYAVDCNWTMGPKMAAAANFRREYLSPNSSVLDSSYTATGRQGINVDTDTLKNNSKNTFYAYVYRNIIKPLYVGYAFSWTHTHYDRKVMTNYTSVSDPYAFPPQEYAFYEWAYYPYPSPRKMLAHIASLAGAYAFANNSLILHADIAFPFYSKQELVYHPASEDEGNFIVPDTIAAYDRRYFPVYTEKFTGPLTFSSELKCNITGKTLVAVSYDYFGFPYKKWAYLTEDSYSLHTISLTIKRSFK